MGDSTDTRDTTELESSGSALMRYYEGDQIDQMRDYIKTALDNNSFNCQELIDLAKSSPEAASLVKELILLNRVDMTELAERIAKEIVKDIEMHADDHLEKYQKYTLNVPQMSSSLDKWRSKFFNMISLLKDVSILARKLLETSPRFEWSPRPPSQGPPQITTTTTTTTTYLNPQLDRKIPLSASSAGRDTKSQMSEEDATSEDLLAALIESSSSDDFLVLSSSLDSIALKDMLVAALTLITSHECFTLAHDIQGVAMVLRRAKFMIKNILAPKNQMELIIRLLTSIGRFNEMKYVFDLFRDRNQFEILLSKGVDKTPELRIALFNYVKKNPEFYALVTLNFSMFREIAESLEASAAKRLDKLIQSRKTKRKKSEGTSSGTPVAGGGVSTAASRLAPVSGGGGSKADEGSMKQSVRSLMTKSNSIGANLSSMIGGGGGGSGGGSAATSTNLASGNNNRSEPGGGNNNKPLYSRDQLAMCLVELVDASDCFAKAGCYKRSNSCESRAKLIALQLALLATGETNVLDLQQTELNDTIVGFESFFDAHIVAKAYNYHLSWRQALFRNVVLRGQSGYLRDFCSTCELSTALIMELVILFKQYISNANNQSHLSHEEISRYSRSMQLIIGCLKDVELKCKLYNQLDLAEARDELLKSAAIRAHLNDLRLV